MMTAQSETVMPPVGQPSVAYFSMEIALEIPH
jgi:hypothetical protein